MFVIMAVAADDRSVGQAAAIAIGGAVLLDARFGVPIRSASMNPGRLCGPSFRLRIMSTSLGLHCWADHWVGARRPHL